MDVIGMMKKRSMKLAFMSAVVALVITPALAAYAQGTAAALSQLVSEAKKEGKVLWYESSPETAIAEVGGVFNKRYPGIKLEQLRLSGTEVGTKILVDSQGGGPTADIGTTGPTICYDLAEKGLVQKVNWQELGVDSKVIGDPTALATCAVLFIVVYNSKMVSEAEVPKTWDDLLNPKWKGKFGLWVQPQPEALLASVWGIEKAMDFLKKLKAQEPRFKESSYMTVMDVAAGEYPWGIMTHTSSIPPIKKGAPLKHVFLDPTPMEMLHSFIPIKGTHPNAAKLFMVWLHSREGNIAYENVVYRANPRIQGTNYSKLVANANVRLAEYPFDRMKEYSEAMRRMSDIMK